MTDREKALTVLRTTAQNNPANIPKSILFYHDSRNIVIFDSYPKSIFHFLVLPRLDRRAAIPDGLSDWRLKDLKTLLSGKKDVAKDVIESMHETAKVVIPLIEAEMNRMFDFKWDIWMGFHGAPSMEHLHLHILSADLVSEKMKTKKHYNSFHPKLGFFLHIKDVISWFEIVDSRYNDEVRSLKGSAYSSILKEPLMCFHEDCIRQPKNMPSLKDHLQEEWDKLHKRGKRSKEILQSKQRKRKAAAHSKDPSDTGGGTAPPSKRQRSEPENQPPDSDTAT